MKTPVHLQILFIIFAALALTSAPTARATPLVIRVDGMIYDNYGNPLTASPALTVAAFAAASGGSALWGPSSYTPTVTNGKFTLDLDASSGTPSLAQVISNQISASQPLWFELSYGGNTVRPRIRSRGTSFAVGAATADSLASFPVSTATPANTDVLLYNGSQWSPGSLALATGYIAKLGDTMTGNLLIPGYALNSASVSVISLSATHLVRASTGQTLISVTANVADSDLANIAGTTANIQTQINGKYVASSAGNLTTPSSALTITGGTGSVIGSGAQLTVATGSGSQTGLLQASDWNSFNAKAGAAGGGAQAANTFYAGPLTGTAVPAFRNLAASDLGTGTASSSTFLRGDQTWAPPATDSAGTIMAWGSTIIPAGWLWCDGSSYLRAGYPALYSAIGTAYGTTDSLHFNVPDLRGRFLRGTDNFGVGASGNDPDTASRTAVNPGGNTGNAVGSYEVDMYVNHTHSFAANLFLPAGGFGMSNSPANFELGGYDSVTNASGGNETRAKNVYVNYIIRAIAPPSGLPATTAQLAQYLPATGATTTGTLTVTAMNASSLGASSVVLTDPYSNLTSAAPGGLNNVLYSNGSAWVAGQSIFYRIAQSCAFGQYLQGFSSTGSPICVTVTPPSAVTFTKVAGAYNSKCALRSDTTVMCWGYNAWGQLGNNTTTQSPVPVYVRNANGSKLSTAVDISGGYGTYCAALSNGTVWCWGLNQYSQLGDRTTTNRAYPVQVVGITTATNVAVQGNTSCALLSTGNISCWGYGSNGELGNGTTVSNSTAVGVSGISTATAIAGGTDHACAVLASGNAQCWGYNNYGQLGNNTTTSSSTPVTVKGSGGSGTLTTVTQIAASDSYGDYDHTCAVKSDGTVWCWGYGANGQLGNGAAATSYYPVQATGIANGTYVAVGGLDTCAVLSTGGVECWGYNQYGCAGNGTTGEVNSPVVVQGIGGTGTLSIATQVTISGSQNGSYWTESTSAVTNTGQVFSWGYDGNGDLGNGAYTSMSYPVGVPSP